jgi:uncharacterized membrane protein
MASDTRQRSIAAQDDAAQHIVDNVEAVAALYEGKQQRTQRGIEVAARFVGRPRFLITSLALVAMWVIVNALLPRFGAARIDPPPFFWLQGAVAVSAWVTASVVLISQNRQARLAEQRAHIDLQINLLSEKKVAKLIALVEELRRDLPSVGDRHDPEAQAMSVPADPRRVADAIEDRLDPSGPAR